MTNPLIVNTRADLNLLKGTPSYLEALRQIAGSLTTTIDRATYPEGYGSDGYDGPVVEPEWTEVESLGVLARLGFSREEFEAEYAAATGAAIAE